MSLGPALVATVARIFGETFDVSRPRPFGGDRAVHQGISDDVAGVQWNAGVDRSRNVVTVGVNLEGKQYDGWPIARLIERELRHPALVEVAAAYPKLGNAELWFSRDAWQISSRPAIVEQWIGGAAPVLLTELTHQHWRRVLEEAYSCLDESRGHRGRTRQEVTLVKKGKTVKDVSPHLQIKHALQWSAGHDGGLRAAMKTTRELLQPIHDWAKEASRA